MKKELFGIAVFIGLIVLACGCIEDQVGDNGGITVEKSTVTFMVTDKVTEIFDHVYVNFSEIRLFNQTEDDDSYITVVSDETKVDLVALNLSQISAPLGVAEIEVGNYSKLWINVTKVVGVLNSTGEEVNITVPSGWLKIQQLHLFNFTKGNHTITIDIDLENSIHAFHGGEEYKFVPVISSIEHFHENKLKFREKDQSNIKNMVGNRKPIIDIIINGTIVENNVNLDANVSYEFNASGSFDFDEGDELTYSWNFGDNQTAVGSIVNHKYPDEENKTYQLYLTVSDGTDEAIYHVVVKINNSSAKRNPGPGDGQE